MTSIISDLNQRRMQEQQAEREAQQQSFDKYAALLLAHAEDPAASTEELQAEILGLGLSDADVEIDLEKIAELRYDLQQVPHLAARTKRAHDTSQKLIETEADCKQLMQAMNHLATVAKSELQDAHTSRSRIERLRHHARLASIAIVPEQIEPAQSVDDMDYSGDFSIEVVEDELASGIKK